MVHDAPGNDSSDQVNFPKEVIEDIGARNGENEWCFTGQSDGPSANDNQDNIDVCSCGDPDCLECNTPEWFSLVDLNQVDPESIEGILISGLTAAGFTVTGLAIADFPDSRRADNPDIAQAGFSEHDPDEMASGFGNSGAGSPSAEDLDNIQAQIAQTRVSSAGGSMEDYG